MVVRVLLTISLLLANLTIASAQQAPPPLMPPPQKPPEIDSPEVVRITTNLVQVDVSVTRDGKPVADLQPEDFEIFEDGKPQTITNFSYVSNIPGARPAPASTDTRPKDPTAPLVPPAQINLSDQRRTIALVVDDLGMSFESIARLRLQIKKFLDTLLPSDLVAIIRTGGEV